jgi:hypothetical protein
MLWLRNGPEIGKANRLRAGSAACRGLNHRFIAERSLCGPLRGEMRLQEHLHGSRTGGSFSPLPVLTEITGRNSAHPVAGVSPAFNRLAALAVALFLLPLSHELFAQAPPEPDANMDQPYSAQYDPGQQPGYAQPYPQSQPYSQQPYSNQMYPQPVYGQQPAYGQIQPTSQPLSADQLEQLVAPIALYPDSLLALMLAASTYPAQVADADRWRQAQGYASSDQIAAGAGLQGWDPSVKALTAFPQVLSEMDANLAWTTALGNTYYNQPQDVLQAIQIMRQRAQTAGSLQSTPQQLVSYNQSYIQIVPANPEVVYVPAYNPWTVYGQPVSPYPGFSLFGALGSFLNSSTLRFGLGMAMSAFNHTPFGLLGWGLNWLTQNVLFHQSNYYSNSTSVADWGLPHGGPRAFTGPRSIARLPGSSYSQPGRGYNPAPAQGFLRSQDIYASNWPRENYNRGYQTPVFNNTRPTLQAWNRNPAPISRPQTSTQPYNRPNFNSALNNSYGMGYAARPGQTYTGSYNQTYNRSSMPVSRPQTYAPAHAQTYNRPSYGSGYGSGSYSPWSAYAGRPAQTSSGSSQAYRAPSASFERSNYGQRSAFMGNGFMNSSAKPQNSNGFHLFGGEREPKSFSESKAFKKEEKQFAKEERSFGGGHSGGFHSFGGGHSSHGGHHRL